MRILNWITVRIRKFAKWLERENARADEIHRRVQASKEEMLQKQIKNGILYRFY